MSRITKHREHKKSTKALRKALDKTKGFVYNLLQTLLAFLVAIQAKPKGVLHKMFARISREVPAISQFFSSKKGGHNMATLIRRVVSATLLSALAIALVACGGGGGSSTPTTPTPPAKTPVAGDFTYTLNPANGATGVAVDTKVVLQVKVNAGGAFSATTTIVCGGVPVDHTMSMPASPSGTFDVTFTPSKSLPYGTTCAWNGSATVAGVDGGVAMISNWSTSFTTVSWWPPKVLTNIGEKGTGIQVAPTEGNILRSPPVTGVDWKKATIDGTLKYTKTGMTLTGINTRPLYVAVFIEPVSKGYCLAPVYADDGLGVFSDPYIYGMCYSTPFDAWWGADDGVIVRFPSLSNGCYKVIYEQGVGFRGQSSTAISCPN